MRLNKLFLALAATTIIASGVMAQSKFWTGINTTNDPGTAIWGDGNRSSVELTLAPGSDFYLFFRAQFQPGFGNSTAWAIINAFFDLTRQYGNYTGSIQFYDTSNLDSSQNRGWTQDAQNSGYTLQTIRSGEIRANSVHPGNTNFPLVTPQGVAYKILVPGGTSNTSLFAFGWVRLRVNAAGTYELGLNRLAGYDLEGNGSLIGSEGVTVRTNFGTNGNPYADYGNRYSVTLLVPEPASMIALGSGLVGLLALRRRRSN